MNKIDKKSNRYNEVYGIDIFKKSSEIKIIEYLGMLWNLKSPSIGAKELENGYFLIYDKYNIIILDNYFNFKLEINDLNEIIYHVSELISNNSDNDINLGIITLNKFITISIDMEKNYNKIEYYDYEGIYFLQLNNDEFIICEVNKTIFYCDFFNKICKHIKSDISNKQSCNCLCLNEKKNLIVFSSNEILPGGENKLIFYDLIKKEDYKNIEGSFIVSNNGLFLLKSQNKNHKKILLSGCKKYNSNQKNGILISISSFDKSADEILSNFYVTENFEVYCFCEIILKEENNNMKNNSKYFFVGGFDEDLRQGLIKLYKAYFDEPIEKNKIEFIINIVIEHEEKKEVEIYKKKSQEEIIRNQIYNKKGKNKEYNIVKINQNFKGFRGPITSIMQTSSSGNILVSCEDGNIYLFTMPNLDFFLSK